MSRRFSVRRSPSWRRAQSLDLVADFAVAGQIARLELASGDPPGGLELGTEVLGFLPVVHQPGGLQATRRRILSLDILWRRTQAVRDTGNGRMVGVPHYGRLSNSIHPPLPQGKPVSPRKLSPALMVAANRHLDEVIVMRVS